MTLGVQLFEEAVSITSRLEILQVENQAKLLEAAYYFHRSEMAPAKDNQFSSYLLDLVWAIYWYNDSEMQKSIEYVFNAWDEILRLEVAEQYSNEYYNDLINYEYVYRLYVLVKSLAIEVPDCSHLQCVLMNLSNRFDFIDTRSKYGLIRDFASECCKDRYNLRAMSLFYHARLLSDTLRTDIQNNNWEVSDSLARVYHDVERYYFLPALACAREPITKAVIFQEMAERRGMIGDYTQMVVYADSSCFYARNYPVYPDYIQWYGARLERCYIAFMDEAIQDTTSNSVFLLESAFQRAQKASSLDCESTVLFRYSLDTAEIALMIYMKDSAVYQEYLTQAREYCQVAIELSVEAKRDEVFSHLVSDIYYRLDHTEMQQFRVFLANHSINPDLILRSSPD